MEITGLKILHPALLQDIDLGTIILDEGESFEEHVLVEPNALFGACSCFVQVLPCRLLLFLKPQESSSSHSPPLPAVQFRPNIEVEVQPALTLTTSPLTFALIEINHVFDLLPIASLHHPIVSIERRLIPAQRSHSRSWTQTRPGIKQSCISDQSAQEPRLLIRTGAQAAKAEELRSSAAGRGVAFPLLDKRPGALVDGVVDGDYGGHGAGEGGGVGGGGWKGILAQDGSEELVLGRVDPVAGGGVGARFAFGVRRCSERGCGRRPVRVCAGDAGYHSIVGKRAETFW